MFCPIMHFADRGFLSVAILKRKYFMIFPDIFTCPLYEDINQHTLSAVRVHGMSKQYILTRGPLKGDYCIDISVTLTTYSIFMFCVLVLIEGNLGKRYVNHARDLLLVYHCCILTCRTAW